MSDEVLRNMRQLIGEEAERFRLRARQCRELAAVARDHISRDELAQMAIELDMEADRIDAEEDVKDTGNKLG
ncbi:MAG TPA: hypothetical protein VGM04_00630 [Sphingomicrobium sp.]|jgi:hypothetical protein